MIGENITLGANYYPSVSFKTVYKKDYDKSSVMCSKLISNKEDLGELVVKIIPEENTLFIEEVFVKRNHRGKGLGKRLVAFAEEIGCRKRLSNIHLNPYSIDPYWISNTDLVNWYKKQGYVWNKGIMIKDTQDKDCYA